MATATQASGQDNARAQVASIQAIYELARFANLWDDDKRLFGLSTEAAELLEQAGYNFDTDDLTSDHVRDVAWDACRSASLGVDYSATWSAGCEFHGQPDSFKVWLSVGGPSCWVSGDFGLHGSVDADSLRVFFSWASPNDFLWLNDAEREAVAWFVNEVAQ